MELSAEEQCTCEEVEFRDDSFDHEYGTERVWHWECIHCGKLFPLEAGDYEDSWEDNYC